MTTFTAAISSHQVAWWTVHEYVTPVLSRHNYWPTVGTPDWCLLADDDPARQAAVFDAAQHWALHVEINQEVRAEASRAVSEAADWRAAAQQFRQRNDFYTTRPWMKRVTA